MSEENLAVITECLRYSLEGKIHFGEVVRRLLEIGVERYHTDYSRGEHTYYMPDGISYVVAGEHVDAPIAREFSSAGVEAAIRKAQRGEIMFPEFVRETSAAGCVGYFAQLSGRRVIYFGRNGDIHVEPFPTAPIL